MAKNPGGVTQGPRHSEGGIPTRFGELEGGEAVINKRSTAMFTGLLSKMPGLITNRSLSNVSEQV